MNICIVNIRENNPYIGGVERVSYILGHDWLKKGHNVIFLSQYRSKIDKPYKMQCKEFFLPNSNDAVSRDNIKYFIEVLSNNNVEVIINQGSVFPELCNLCKIVKQKFDIPLITAIHYAPLYQVALTENNFFIREKLGYSFTKWIMDVLLYFRYHLREKKQLILKEKKKLSDISSYSDAIVCLSKSFIPTFKGLLDNGFTGKLVAIANPVLTDKVPTKMPKKKQILYVGRLEFGLKRVDRLIKIWAKTEQLFPDWSFRVVGGGDMRAKLEQMTNNYRLKNIYFDGFQEPDKYYAESPIICLTSSSEGFGMVLVEALQQQCIPIAYNSFASLSDIVIDNVNGYCIPPFDEKIYLQKLHNLMKYENERIRLASNSNLTLDQFQIDEVSKRWMNLFSDLSN